jgi:hypothetical protein
MKTILIFMLLIVPQQCVAYSILIIPKGNNNSENRANLDSIKIKSQNVSIVFWNVENLYDTYDDTTKLDDEFTALGSKHWTWSKFILKLNNLAKTLLAIGEWIAPAIVGLCEVENRYVLNKLIYETPLKTWKYKFIHHESPDLRGVDVALIYRPAIYNILTSRSISIRFPFDTLAQTREILMVNGILLGTDTITIFVNHWPSRRGGYLESQPRRNYVASVLRKLIDSVTQIHPASNIVVMGDFNDEPEDESLKLILGAQTNLIPFHQNKMYNLMGINNQTRMEGTLKYRDQWNTFDQFIVTGALLKGSSGLKADNQDVRIFKSSFLLENDNTYFGEKLNRTYVGPRYHGGFSDHLPIHLKILKTDKPAD